MADVPVVTDFYGRWARVYDLIARRTPGIGAVRDRTVDALELEPGDTVVEMGCGTGANFPFLRDRVGDAGRVIGVDLTPGMLDVARRWIDREGWQNVHVVTGDAAEPPIQGADAILSTFVVAMLDDPAAAVGRWCASLGPDGRIALLDSTANAHSLGRVGNALFEGYVRATTPPTMRFRYGESLGRRLDEQVTAARAELDRRAETAATETLGLGFLQLVAARVP